MAGEIFVRRGDDFEVIGAVVPGSAVPLRAVVGKLLLDVLAALGELEQHVLHQVGHAGFAITFVPRTHQVGDVDGKFRLGVVGEQKHAQSVGEVVFGDAFHGGDFLLSLYGKG